MKKTFYKILLVATIILAGTITAEASSTRWQTDEDITSLLSGLDIMVGDDNGDFALDTYVTRAQMTKIAVASSSYKNTVAIGLQFSPFSDVKGSYWGAPYIRAAVSAGLAEGYIDGTFRPDATVTYEEAITMMLRVLGYTADDFGASYPYGQIGMAQSLKMTDGMSAGVGEALTRRDVAKLVCNTLNTKSKTTNQDLIAVHDCQFIEDVTIVASQLDDGALGADEISTSSGKYKIDENFDDGYVGCRGDMVVKDGKYVVAFSSDTALKTEKYVIYSTLNDAILCCPEGNNTKIEQFKISDSTTCYKNSVAYNYGSIRQQMEIGDIVRIRYRDDGEVDYITYSEGNLRGPIKVVGNQWANDFNMDSNTKIVRDGKMTDRSSIEVNDILYYSDSLNMVMAYTQKVTGVYEDAIPSKDLPNSIVLSGVTYQVEGVDAFNDLSSNGTVNIGDTITVLLGRDGEKIAGIATADSMRVDSVVGYVIGAGKKQFTHSDGTTYTSYYIQLVTPDNTVYTYPTVYDKSSFVNSVVTVRVRDEKAEVGNVTKSGAQMGMVSYANMKIGNNRVADNVQILDVAKNPYSDETLYTKTYMQRLDGLDLDSSDVLYYSTNAKGEIERMILKNVTGDMYLYGIVTAVSKDDSRVTIECNNATYTKSGIGSLRTGLPVKVSAQNGVIGFAEGLKETTGNVTELAQGYAVVGNSKFLLSDKVQVYKETGTKYMKISLNEAISGQYRYTCYYDKAAQTGGRIRVIIVK